MDRLQNIDCLIMELLREQGLHYPLPGTLEEKQRLLRGLMNIRPPWPASAGLLSRQDKELQMQLADKGIVELSDAEVVEHTGHYTLRLWQGDITRLRADAIVNAANSQMLGCFVPMHRCIDNAIHSAAGIQLRQACAEIVQGEVPTGSAHITRGYNLPAQYVIHTIGPIVPDGIPTPEQERLLASCYTSCLALADQKELDSIVFNCISTGEYRFPNRRAAEIAVGAVRLYLGQSGPPHSVKTVVFDVFKQIDYDEYRHLLAKN